MSRLSIVHDRVAFGLAMVLLVSLVSTASRADEPGDVVRGAGERSSPRSQPVRHALPRPTSEARRDRPTWLDVPALQRQAAHVVLAGLQWYRVTPPGERVCWGGLIACAALGSSVLLERFARLRRRRIIPPDFIPRFIDRLHEGKLDGGKALDYCEMNPSPAARIALAAVRRWGRPAADLERAVSLAHRVETERLRRNVGTLRRIALLGPMLGLLGSLLAVSRVLTSMSQHSGDLGPLLAGTLSPVTMGLALATVALVVYDALMIRIERLAGALDRLGAETIDAIAVTTATTVGALPVGSVQAHGPEPRPIGPNSGMLGPHKAPYRPATYRRPVESTDRRHAPGDHMAGF
jgi:biopolymer transport protein ExbB